MVQPFTVESTMLLEYMIYSILPLVEPITLIAAIMRVMRKIHPNVDVFWTYSASLIDVQHKHNVLGSHHTFLLAA